MIGGQKREGSDIIVQILINGKDRTRKYDKFGSEIQYNITWDSDKPNKKYLTIFNFCEFALHSYDIWNSKDGDILERIQYHEKFNVITRDRFIFNKNRYWLKNKKSFCIKCLNGDLKVEKDKIVCSCGNETFETGMHMDGPKKGVNNFDGGLQK